MWTQTGPETDGYSETHRDVAWKGGGESEHRASP